MGKIVGIDFGTTNSLAAYTLNGIPRIIKDPHIEHALPSVVCKYDGKLYVGKEAKENIGAFLDGNGVSEIKREIGSDKQIYFDGKQMQPFEISAIILRKIKGNLKLYFKEDIEEAVITVPAEFSDLQRKEIICAGEAAGFKVKKIINEPTAALLAYAHVNNVFNQNVLCYDFGGGTFDLSLARIERDRTQNQEISVLAVGGDRKLGGGDIDRKLLEYFLKDIQTKHQTQPDRYGMRQLILEVEKAKIELSTSTSALVNISNLSLSSTRRVSYMKRIERRTFEDIATPFVDKTVKLIRTMLSENRIDARSIHSLLLVGGSSRIPLISEKIKAELGLSTTFGKLNPDECVALGASIEAANLSGVSGMVRSIIIKQDVCPFTLGLKYDSDGIKDRFDPLISKNFPYGEDYSEQYHTIFNNQTSMELEIYQGESEDANLNEYVTTVSVKGIPAREAGKEFVKVTFSYDKHGILNVKTKILSTGKEQVHVHKYGFNLDISEEIIERVEEIFIDPDMVDDAVLLADIMKKQGDLENHRHIYEAIKYEDEDRLEMLIEDLLD